MRISRVETQAFSISEQGEKEGVSRVEKDPLTRIHKRYLPLARLRVVKSKGMSKGMLLKKNTTNVVKNNLYVDLVYGNIYYASPKGMISPKPVIQKSDILKKISGFPAQIISILNHIWERGGVQIHDLSKEAIQELVRLGLVAVYETGDSQLMNIIRIAADNNQVVKHSAKATFTLPKIGDRKYDLSTYFEAGDTIDGGYERDPIRQSVKKIIETAEQFYNCDAALDGITYLPYLVNERKDKEAAEETIQFIACAKGEPAKRNYPSEARLTPISLSTELYEGESVPIEKETITFNDLGGLYQAKREIAESIIYPFLKPELSKKFGQKSGGGILMYGPPGCGKTQLARAAVAECNVSFYNVNVSDIMNEQGNEAKRLHEVFERAGDEAPSIIFFDEVDALCSRKASADESRKKVLNQFLMDMSGVERISEGVLVIGATNVPWELDPALRRAGRFTKQIYVPPPDREARLEILKINTLERPLAPDVDLGRIADQMEGYSGADIAEICNSAARIPWKNALAGASERDVGMGDFQTAIKEHKPSLLPWALLAKKQVEESDETLVYEELMETVDNLLRVFGKKQDRREGGGGLESLRKQKQVLEQKIRLLQEKKEAGTVREDVCDDLMEDYILEMSKIDDRLKELT